MFQDHYLDSSTLDHIHEVRTKQKGITQCDFGYIAIFDPKDKDLLHLYSKYIQFYRQSGRLEEKDALVEYFEQFLSRKYQDKTVHFGTLPEPLHVGYKSDRVVFPGLERIANLVTGNSSRTFTHYAIGTGSAPVLPADQDLDFEESRVSMNDTGFAESKGSSMVFAANFPTTLPSMVVTESGIFDRNLGGVMLLRTLYEGANAVSHVFNQTFVATSHFVYQLSV